MTYEEALRQIERLKERGFVADKGILRTDMACDMAIDAIKRQILKKPIYTNKGTVTRCPNCLAIHFKVLPSILIDYCGVCGQAIDWSEVEE